MILLCGIPSETPLGMVREKIEQAGLPFILFNQRRFAEMSLTFEVSRGHVDGELTVDGSAYPLSEFSGVYIRLMDDRALPELRGQAEDSRLRRYCRALHTTLTQWCEIAPARVVNRMGPMGSNSSKPYQAQLIKEQGFRVPETLITNDPAAVLDFRARYKRLIYKSISGLRSIVQEFCDKDIVRLDQIRWCPTQFQAYVEGMNVRVHVVGDRAFATAVHSEATDYRYASQQVGHTAKLEAVTLDKEVEERCIRLSHTLGLDFSGIDLMLTPGGAVYCFEVNPCPAFSYYESNTGQQIASAVAHYLAGKTS